MASLALMIWASVKPASNGVFYLAIGVFIGCSAAWIAVQLTQVRRAPFGFVLGAGVLLLVFGVPVLIARVAGIVWHPDNTLTVAACACAYLGAGFLVELLREAVGTHAWPFWTGLVCFACGAVVVVGVGIALLRGTASGTLLVIMLGAAALLLLPIGLNVLSEQALKELRPNDGGAGQKGRFWQRVLPWLRKRWVWAVSGLVLSAGAVIFLTVRSHSGWTVLIAAACALGLLAALVSNTHADIVAVLCAIALLGVAPSEVDVVVAQHPGAGPSDLLALGDSYMSGEGAAAYIRNTDENENDTCRRAPTAYAVLAVGPEKPFGHVTFLACSGARTYNVLPRPPGGAPAQGSQPQPAPQKGESGTQVDEITALGTGYQPRLAIIALGGNDAGFSDLGEACVAPGDCSDEQNLFLGNLRRVRSALVTTYQSIRAALPATPVVVVPYPQPLADVRSCGAIALTIHERMFIRNFLTSLNQIIHSAADQVRFYYLDTMENALAAEHLQLCDPANKGGYGINFVSLGSVNGLPDQRFNPVNWLHDSFHPNELGHQAMLDAFDAWLDNHPGLTSGNSSLARDAPIAAVDLASGLTLPAAPSCSFDSTLNSCQTVLRKWDFRQILALWPYSICILIGLIGLWMLSVAGVSLCPAPSLPRPSIRELRASRKSGTAPD